MSPVYLLPFFILGIQAKHVNSTICDGVQANFNMTSVAGTWYVASVMAKLETNIGPRTVIPCYKVEFIDIKKVKTTLQQSATRTYDSVYFSHGIAPPSLPYVGDIGHIYTTTNTCFAPKHSIIRVIDSTTATRKDDLPQATKQSLKYESPMNMVEHEGSLILQKFSSERPAAIIWSKSTSGFNGCYQQAHAFDMERSFLTQGVIQSSTMQLHLIDGDPKREEITGPILIQTLWEETMIAVIYRKQMEYDSDFLVDTVLEAMEDFRKGLTIPYASYCAELFKNE